MFFREVDNRERWKLIDFDSCCFVGEPVIRGTLEFCAPEIIRCLHQNRTPHAAFSQDIFSLGRVLLWLVTPEEPFWPGLPEDATEADKEAWLVTEEELSFDALVEHTPTRNLLHEMLQKEPERRITLTKIKNGSFLSMNLDTKTLATHSN